MSHYNTQRQVCVNLCLQSRLKHVISHTFICAKIAVQLVEVAFRHSVEMFTRPILDYERLLLSQRCAILINSPVSGFLVKILR
jgi:hypothetical protein